MDNIQRKLLIKKDKNANQIVNFSSLVDETSIIFSGKEDDDFIIKINLFYLNIYVWNSWGFW